MKDAKGHGSDAYGDSLVNDRLKRSRIGMLTSAVFSNRHGGGGDRTDTQRTVVNLRTQMQNTGPGHQAGLLQGIKNLMGD
jgi:hypothetical protein